MNTVHLISCGCLLLVAVLVDIAQPTCVLESDFGFKINCAFKKAGLFRVRNLGGIKAHASLGFSLGDELGFEQSLTNLDPSRRRSVNVNNGIPPNLVPQSTPRSAVKQEKRGKQNRIMMRPPAPINRPNKSAMDRLSSLHRRVSSTMQPIVVGPTIESPTALNRINPSVTVAKPMPMGVPPFKPLPPKEDTLKVLPITATTKKAFTPLQLPQSKGPGLAYQSESYPHVNHDQVSKMVSQMTASHVAPTQLLRITPTSIIVNTPRVFTVPTTINPFIPMPVAAPPTQAINIIPAPVLKDSVLIPLAPSMLSKTPTAYSLAQNTLAIQKTNPNSDFLDPVPHQVHDLANFFNTKKIDDYNSITGYGDEVTLNFKKEDINAKIAEIAKAGNISMEAVEAAIALRQQQLLSKYANIPIPTTTTTTSTTTTTTEEPALIFQAEPEPEIIVASVAQKPKRNPTSGKVMNAPREYYPVGYEKDFDDHFQSKVDLPGTNFHCGDQKYFPGLYGDENLGCMVFHVCALTDDGLVMKSFLCPESTLFDQTILKCNWWFYVDCKNTRRLYDTNIPVSKSYQLMKALTFFSSYKKEMQDDGDRSTNPEDVEGIKEAISILENQNTPQQTATNTDTNNEPNAIQIITPKPVIDERHNNHRLDANDTSPIYRGNRDYKNVTNTNTEIKKISARFRSNQQTKAKSQEQPNSELRLVTLNAGFSVNDDKKSNSAENRKVPLESTTEKRHKRKMTLKSSNVTTTTINPTTKQSVLRESVEANDFKSNTTEIKQENLTDQVENLGKIDAKILKEAENSPPIKRFYRSSAEIKNDNKEIAMVNNQKVQIVRPTSYAKLVGEYQTPTATISKLDEAILGRPVSRFKKEVIIITPEKLDRSRDT